MSKMDKLFHNKFIMDSEKPAETSTFSIFPCPTFRARLTATGCIQNQQSPNENTRAICRACQNKIAIPIEQIQEKKSVRERQSERAKMRRNIDDGKGLQGFRYKEEKQPKRRADKSLAEKAMDKRPSRPRPASVTSSALPKGKTKTCPNCGYHHHKNGAYCSVCRKVRHDPDLMMKVAKLRRDGLIKRGRPVQKIAARRAA